MPFAQPNCSHFKTIKAPAAPTAPVMPLAVLPDAATVTFDAAPVFAHVQGVMSITLTTRRFIPDGRGGVVEQDVVSGFLRCTPDAAQALKQAIDAGLLLAGPTSGKPQ